MVKASSKVGRQALCPSEPQKENSRNAAARPPEHVIRGSQRMLTLSPLAVKGFLSIPGGLASKAAGNLCSLRSHAQRVGDAGLQIVKTRLPFEGRMGRNACDLWMQAPGNLLPASPPAEKATARQDQAGQTSTGDGDRDSARRGRRERNVRFKRPWTEYGRSHAN
jgi:hypothetical protein